MTERWVRDTGLVFALIALIFAYYGNAFGLPIAALLIFLVLFVPSVLRPLAYVWLTVAEVLGTVMNRVFFSLVFFAIVTPVGILMRIVKGDRRDEQARNPHATAFVDRVHSVTADDLIRPF